MSRASDHAYTVIRGMILAGELPPGTQLSEEALALRCEVSRTPVRDALRRLESDLLIRRSESQRSFVADWSDDDIEDAFELRAMLEAQAARRAATRIAPAQVEALRHHNRLIGAAIAGERPDIPAFLDNNRAFHEIILTAAGSSRLASLLTRLIEQPVVWRTAQNYDRENLQRSHHEHEELIAAFARGDAAWAASIMTGHIRRAFHAYLDAYTAQRTAAE
ncbi:MAG: GntR family transcriptional regulator [Novosphingobium sp.]|uniref:GntR family transcriptional regulator n=1 Tax=Novosphingobium sp. TaxID=1874826 RepID=UPI00391BB4C1|nr:GntR family transcriptional regulator [Novosphingobium sp.]